MADNYHVVFKYSEGPDTELTMNADGSVSAFQGAPLTETPEVITALVRLAKWLARNGGVNIELSETE